jgi:S1-C subfamily serine protease
MRIESARGRRFIPFFMAVLFLAAGVGSVSAQEPSAEDIKAVKNHRRSLVSVMKKVNPSFIFIGGGSGVVISEDGLMLTNNHVAQSKSVWQVHTPGGKRYTANVLGSDPRGDLTLLKLKLAEGEKLPYVKFGNSDQAKTGDTVFAVGNPIGIGNADYSPTFSVGVISVVNRNHANYTDCIQTDAPINPGNSGGPLLNLNGELLGINGMIQTRFQSRVNSGVGYAISVEQCKLWVPELKKAKGGSVPHATASGIAVRRKFEEKGALLARVTGTAKKAGLKSGDRILFIDDRPVTNFARFNGIIGMYPGGSSVELKVVRGEEKMLVTLKLDNRGRAQARRNTRPRGQQPQPRGQQRPNPNGAYLGCQLSPSQGGGVTINQIVEGGPMSKSTLKVGDRIVGFNGAKISDIQSLIALLGKEKPGNRAKFEIVRGGKTIEVVMTLGSRPRNMQ